MLRTLAVLVALTCLAALPYPGPVYVPWTAGADGGGGAEAEPSSGSDLPEPLPGPFPSFTRTTGLKTNTTELARGSSSVWGSFESSLDSNALSARDSWDHTITPGDWSGAGGDCRPVGAAAAGNDTYDLTDIAADIYAMVLRGVKDDDSTYFDAAYARLLEVQAITDLESADLSGANQCILDASTAVMGLTEAAWLLGEADYPTWTLHARLDLAEWLRDEVFPLADWAAVHRKNNWGAAGLAAAYEIALFNQGSPADAIYGWDGTGYTSTAYSSTTLPTLLSAHLSASVSDELDSDCAADNEVFGQQSTGAFPDELRRVGGTANCGQTSLAYACSGSQPHLTGCGQASFYQQKATNLLVRLAESLRRVEGDGADLFDLTDHGGSNTRLVDAFRFGTTLFGSPAYQGIALDDNAQGARYVLGQYEQDGCIVGVLDDGSTFARGGRDLPYASITHANGVAYTGQSLSTDCGFVSLASSDLASIADLVPTIYYSETPDDLAPSPVDTSGWTGYDVTCESSDGGCTAEAGMTKFPAAWGCDPMEGDGSTDDGPAFQCQFAALSAQEYLYIPDGTGDYVLDSFTSPDIFIQPDSSDDQQGIICESRNAVLSARGGNDGVATEDEMRIIRTDADAVVTDFYDDDGMVQNSTWQLTGDFTVGEVGPFTTDGTHTLVAGDWVTITSERLAPQQSDDQVWTTVVASAPSGTTFTIEHPLPDTLGTTGIGATEWDPQEEFVVRNCTFEHEDGTHLLRGKDDLISIDGCANCEISGNALYRGYQHYMVIENSADIWIEGNDTYDPLWDKGPNGYGLRLGGTSRLVAHNNTIQHVQPVAVGAATKSVLLMFNDLRPPEPGCVDIYDLPAGGGGNGEQTSGDGADGYCDADGETFTYDMDCDNNGGDCERPALALHNQAPHPTTVGSTGYLHCSGSEDDASGFGGDSGGCNGSPATGAYGCIEWHNGAGSQGLAMRNHCRNSSVWIDFFEGPGRDNFNFGNWIGAIDGVATIPFSREKGSFVIAPGSAAPPDYRRKEVWANNLFEQDIQRFDDGGDGVQFLDNVVGGSCTYATYNGLSASPASGNFLSECTADGSELSHRPANSVWQHNTVGLDTHTPSYDRTMPSLPGFSAWPSFNGDDTGLTPPYVGPEMGDPDTYTGCLPATRRWNGNDSCETPTLSPGRREAPPLTF